MKSVGRYEILNEIGRGGMGIVYLARQQGLDRLVALKELHTIHASAPDIVQRFVRESRLAGSLNHPNIVTVHDYVEEDGTSYIAMEYMPRGSLRPWVGDLSLAQLAGVLEGLLAGLAAVEPSGIVHRDLKPENVMVAADGRVKITDFGIAKATQSAGMVSFMTATGTTVGTPAYMAPEQALSQEVGPWTDLYSVGVMTYEQLVGHLPFKDSATPIALLLRHVNDPIPPVLDSRPELDPALSEWVERLLVKDPAERTRGATQAWEELEEIVLELLGPRWRREARLPERGSSVSNSRPLTPAPFESGRVATPEGSPAPGGSPPATDRAGPDAPSTTGRTGPDGSPPATGRTGQDAPPRASATPQAPAQPEIESGFLSYGRSPTGIEPPPAFSEQHFESPPVSARPTSAEERPPGETPRERAPARTQRASRPRARLLGAAGFIAVLTAAGGFALAPAGESARSPARSRGASTSAQQHEPSLVYAAALGEAMSRLNRERAAAGARLARATTAGEQTAAAQTLARAHEQAAAAVRSAAPGPPAQKANAAIATALADMGRGYAMMAGAARREDRHGFDAGRSDVAGATTSLAGAFAQLRGLGYPLGG
jgi:serine/threonine protein kinase